MKKYDYFCMPFLIILFITCFVISIQQQDQTKKDSVINKIHFLIPGGPGGGWDTTARSIGETLRHSGLVTQTSYENMSGGGGGKAIAHIIETATHQRHTLMVNSTPIVIRSLQKVFPQSFRDLTPVAGIIGDYSCFVVSKNSSYNSWQEIVQQYQKQQQKITIAGGSVKGGMDHLVAAMVCESCEIAWDDLVYVPYDAGGKALAGLLSGETQILSTGLGEVMELARAGELKILAITSSERIKAVPDVPTFKEYGYNVTFVNWRGFFAPPHLSQHKISLYNDLFQKMYTTTMWNTTRDNNGWTEIYHSGADFTHFLEQQEKQLARLMKKLGFLDE